MNERESDRALEQIFQTALALSAERQAALQARLETQIDQERIAWLAFATVMTRLNTRMQPAIAWGHGPTRRKNLFS